MGGSQTELARLSASRLKEFVETPDPNLKSLGLLALSALQASDKTIVLPCRDAVLKCLDDEPSVRAAALSLISGMVSAASQHALIDITASLPLSITHAVPHTPLPVSKWLLTMYAQ